MNMNALSMLCIVLAFLLFVLSGWSRWWAADPRGPYYPSLFSWGMAFLTFGVWIIPILSK